jgi:acyl-CoA thioesterase-1
MGVIEKAWRAIAILSLLLVAISTLAGCGESVPPLPKLAPGDVVLAFGDSLTYGTGAPSGESYPEVLSILIGHEVIAASVVLHYYRHLYWLIERALE